MPAIVQRLVSNISAHKVFIKQRRERELRVSERVFMMCSTVGMIYDRRELSFRRLGLPSWCKRTPFSESAGPRTKLSKVAGILVLEVLRAPPSYSRNTSSVKFRKSGDEIFRSCKSNMKTQFLRANTDLSLIFGITVYMCVLSEKCLFKNWYFHT